jgi:hypothetical protein
VTLLADFSFPTQENAIVGSLFCSDSTFFFTNYRNRGLISGNRGRNRGRNRGSLGILEKVPPEAPPDPRFPIILVPKSLRSPEKNQVFFWSISGSKSGSRPPPPDPPKTTRNFDTFFLHVFPALFRHVRVSESPDQKNDKKRVRSDAPQEPSPVPSEGTLARGWRGFPTPMRVPLQGTQKVGVLRTPQGEVFDLPRGFGIPKPTLQRLRVHANP